MSINNTGRIVVRMAPSPTGNLHIGGARTTLFNYLYARQNGGKFILRIEDTDRERSKKEYEENIIESLKWLGLEYDELYRQSERGDIYRKHIKQLLDSESVYVSEENLQDSSLEKFSDVSSRKHGQTFLAKNPDGKRESVLRFKNPNKKIIFHDLIRGEVEFDTTDLGDFVVAKSEDEPLYHLAVVVDDYEMKVTHVIRGEEHLSNTARQILILEAIGAPRPEYAHIPLILAPDRSKLSKRHGAVSVLEYRESGFLPEALLNYLALLGWNPGTEQEIFSLEELVQKFDISKVQKGGAIFDEKKLLWVNKEHMHLGKDRIQETISKKIEAKFNKKNIHPEIVKIIFERANTLREADNLIEEGELDYFFDNPQPEKEKIIWKDSSAEDTIRNLKHVITILSSEEEIMSYANEMGRGSVLWPLRYALSGREKSPDPFTLIRILGTEEAEKRIKEAIKFLE